MISNSSLKKKKYYIIRYYYFKSKIYKIYKIFTNQNNLL